MVSTVMPVRWTSSGKQTIKVPGVRMLVDIAPATRHALAIARMTGANTLGVAEMAMTLILAAQSRIVGFGAIGQVVAELLKGFRCRIIRTTQIIVDYFAYCAIQ